MLERQPAGRRDERGKLVRSIADDRHAPRLECLEGGGQVKNRLESGADDQRAVGSSQLVQVGGDIEGLGGRSDGLRPSPPVAMTQGCPRRSLAASHKVADTVVAALPCCSQAPPKGRGDLPC